MPSLYLFLRALIASKCLKFQFKKLFFYYFPRQFCSPKQLYVQVIPIDGLTDGNAKYISIIKTKPFQLVIPKHPSCNLYHINYI